MTKIIRKTRIGKSASILLGCSATIFDHSRKKILLTKRTDNSQWCLPGGRLEPGENAVESCIREVNEETGLLVEVIRLIGVYSDPNFVVEYQDGNRFQIVALSFEARIIGGNPQLSSETSDLDYFALEEIGALDLLEIHRTRIADAFELNAFPFIR